MGCTEAQRLANQRNATRSTGPTTVEGKERSRRNSLKHGLTGAGIVLPTEDLEAIEERFADFDADLRPRGGVQRFLVQRAAMLSVRLDRLALHEAANLTAQTNARDAEPGSIAEPPAELATPLAEISLTEADQALFDPAPAATLARRYEATTERSFYRTLRELRLLQGQQQAEKEAAPPLIRQKASDLGSFRSPPSSAAPAPPRPNFVPTSPPAYVPQAPRSAESVTIGHPPGR